MIDYSKTARGDILKVVGAGAPGFAANDSLVRVTHVYASAVTVENVDGQTADFMFNCGAARLEATEWKDDFPNG